MVTSHGQLGDTGRRIGFYLSEVSHPHRVLSEAGIDIDFVSPRGGEAPADAVDPSDLANAAFVDDDELIGRTRTRMRPKRGARFTAAHNFAPHVAVSDRLVTGQNSASARGVASAVVDLLL